MRVNPRRRFWSGWPGGDLVTDLFVGLWFGCLPRPALTLQTITPATAAAAATAIISQILAFQSVVVGDASLTSLSALIDSRSKRTSIASGLLSASACKPNPVMGSALNWPTPFRRVGRPSRSGGT